MVPFIQVPHFYGWYGLRQVAAIPPLWFEVMYPRLLQWTGGDLSKVNINRSRKDELYAKYGR